MKEEEKGEERGRGRRKEEKEKKDWRDNLVDKNTCNLSSSPLHSCKKPDMVIHESLTPAP